MMKTLVKRKKYSMMAFGSLAIFFSGYPHIWSVYAPYVMDITGWTAGQTSMCFYLTLLFFVIGNIAGGRIQDKSDPIKVLSIGGFIQAAGVFGSAFLLTSNPLPMYLAFGVLQGIGQGMIYTVILATAQKWFPEKKGFATGGIDGQWIMRIFSGTLKREDSRGLWAENRTYGNWSFDGCSMDPFQYLCGRLRLGWATVHHHPG